MRNIEETDCCSAIYSNIVVERPFVVIVVVISFVVWLVSIILGERVGNTFVEYFVSVLWSVWPLGTRNRVRETKIIEKPWQIIRMQLDVELLIDEVLNLLFLPGFAFCK
jgi:hypothetical protein